LWNTFDFPDDLVRFERRLPQIFAVRDLAMRRCVMPAVSAPERAFLIIEPNLR
jgi:hypothetical protein